MLNYFKEKKKKLEKQKNNAELAEKRINTVVKRSGWDYEYAKAQMQESKNRYGIKFGTYCKNNLWQYPIEEHESVVAEAKKERDAVAARLSFINDEKSNFSMSEEAVAKGLNSDLRYDDKCCVESFEMNREGFPKPIIAACCWLNNPLPEGADGIYQPSAYIKPVQYSFADIVSIMGENLIPDTEAIRKEYKTFRKKFRGMGSLNFNKTDLAIFFVDYMLLCRDFGYDRDDYFNFRFYRKDIETRLKFMGDGYRTYVKRVCNNDYKILMDKAYFNDFYRDYIRRDWLDLTRSTKEDFYEFCTGKDCFFAKPITGTGGAGAGIIKVDMDNFDSMYEENKGCIVEEIVKQADEMAKYNASSLNTVRVLSLVTKDNDVKIMGSIVRFGRAGSVVDNLHSGGVALDIDVSTGLIYTDGIDLNGMVIEKHPDSGIIFKDFTVPHWDKMIEQIKAAALHGAEKNRHIGWDVAIRDDGEIELIEGNSRPNFAGIQLDQEGKKYRYEEEIALLAEAKGVEKYTIPDYPNKYLIER